MQEVFDLMDPTSIDCPFYLISRVTLVVVSALKKGLVQADVRQVKPAYLGVLMSLWGEDGLKAVELGRRAGLEPSSMTGLLDRMERDQLVKRTADPSDRRAHRIYLTQQGIDVKGTVTDVVTRIIDTVFIGISDNELDQTKDVLRRILANSNKET